CSFDRGLGGIDLSGVCRDRLGREESHSGRNAPDLRTCEMNYFNYFTEVEDHFVRRRGKHLFVSPLDWSLIATWRDSGIPLHVATRGIDIAMDSFFSRPNRRGTVNSLFYCHETVMEEFARHLESRVGADVRPEEDGGKKADAATDDG